MYAFIRKLLFRLDPETAHTMTLSLLRLAGGLPFARAFLRAVFRAPNKPVQAFGLRFNNPVGLAAGYDKDGLSWRGLACLGFGHIEVGTVTLKPQPGNPHPRLFRLPEDHALINRMGFPGRGADFVARQLSSKRAAGLVIGVNLGKNKDTPLEEADSDYLSLVKIFASLADYLAINVSSPNTVGLRRLQGRQRLGHLLATLAEERQKQISIIGKRIPLLVKLAPDLDSPELDDALQVILDHAMDGVIVTNTTIQREGVSSKAASESGGLSGDPLREISTRMVRQVHQRTDGKLPIIGVGGIRSAAGAREKLDAGATLIQIYTGLVYEGPGLVKSILHAL